ncbi:hypothetical protein Zmor_010356 [Zophobas morio]|uniref:PHD-type domain-containing protein n=1 Tax=Zophobas morio TaxID=2755281 RepID=A0AA38MJX0_9CUCU|nr:hypothetical protein Zmor_013191 [Zophobas morio]KAJ3658627.1 hypothetical protein Zmor_010356 [Zophobas morio]
MSEGEQECCSACKADITDLNKRIQCSGLCNHVFHMDCASVKKAELKVLDNTNFKWFCDNCSILSTNMIGLLTSIKNTVLHNQDQILQQGNMIKKQSLIIENLVQEVNRLKETKIKDNDIISFSTHASRCNENKDKNQEVDKHDSDFQNVKSGDGRRPLSKVSWLVPTTLQDREQSHDDLKNIFNTRNGGLSKQTQITKEDERSSVKYSSNRDPQTQGTTKLAGSIDSEGFMLVKNRKLKRTSQQTVIGTAEVSTDDNSGIKGHERKAWIYVGRVSMDSDDVKLARFICQKIPGARKLSVTKLTTRGNTYAYCVGIDFEYKDRLFEASFWPKGIVVRRFNFSFNKKSMPPLNSDSNNMTQRNNNKVTDTFDVKENDVNFRQGAIPKIYK